MKLPVGIHPNVPMRDYLLDPAEQPSLSSSVAGALLSQSPYHALCSHRRLKPPDVIGDDDSNEATNIGSVAHSLLLEGDESKLVIIDADSFRTKVAREMRDDATAQGLHPILAKRVDDVRRMADVAREYVSRSQIAGVFDKGRPELTLVWQCSLLAAEKLPPVWCRGRPDWLTDDMSMLVHFKTTQGSAEPNQWIRSQLVNQGYDLAFAFYLRGLFALGAPQNAESVFLVQEATAPYCCSLIGMAPGMIDLADRKATRALQLWSACLARGQWPAYSARIHFAEPLPWHETDFADREANRDTIDPKQQQYGMQV